MRCSACELEGIDLERETAVKSASSRSLLVKLLLGYVEELMKQHNDAIRKAKNVFVVWNRGGCAA